MNAVILLIAGMSVCVSVRADDTYIVGGLGPTKFVTEEVQDLVDSVFFSLFFFFLRTLTFLLFLILFLN